MTNIQLPIISDKTDSALALCGAIGSACLMSGLDCVDCALESEANLLEYLQHRIDKAGKENPCNK